MNIFVSGFLFDNTNEIALQRGVNNSLWLVAVLSMYTVLCHYQRVNIYNRNGRPVLNKYTQESTFNKSASHAAKPDMPSCREMLPWRKAERR